MPDNATIVCIDNLSQRQTIPETTISPAGQGDRRLLGTGFDRNQTIYFQEGFSPQSLFTNIIPR